MTKDKTKGKKVKAYALINTKGGLLVVSEKLPIYWLRKIAKEDGFKYQSKVIKVTITYEND